MSRIIRDILYKEVSHCLKNADPKNIANLISTSSLRLDKSTKSLYFLLNPRIINNIGIAIESLTLNNKYFKHVDVIEENSVKQILVHCSRNEIIKSVIESNKKNVELPLFMKSNERVVIDFSSPNIAKPFHVGHLRSTIIGNYISNINTFLGNHVYKINYLGDWGTQFGFVLLGLFNYNDEDIKVKPIETLYKAYVDMHKLSESDPTIVEKARNIFEEMEKGNTDYFEKWQMIKKYTVDELSKTYNRLGVSFDEYHWESMYRAKNIENVLRLIEDRGLLKIDNDDRKVISVNNKCIPIIKSDGTTLYLTRDIAAAIDRFEKYKFDTMYYVVDNSQVAHFSNLIETIKILEFPWADRLKHIRFGRINGMSTRQGTAVFLNNLLDEIKSVMYEKQCHSITTKINVDIPDDSTDILGISAVIVNDFKHRRVSNYDFDWNKALDAAGQTGIKLQYTHARLVNLEENCGVEIATESDPNYLEESCVDDLVLILGQFDEALYKSYKDLEPQVLIKYLFSLSHSINVAFKNLRVKGESQNLASQRLFLFRTSRNVLAQGLKLLGIKPLAKM